MKSSPLRELKLECPHCAQHVLVDNAQFDCDVDCPTCGRPIHVPALAVASAGDATLDSGLSDVADFEGARVKIGETVKGTVREFQKLDYGFLFPLRKFFSAAFIKRRAVRWILTFGLLPLFILFVVAFFRLRFDQSIWLIGGYFCYFWAVYFNGLIRPSTPLWKRGLGYFLFTLVLGIPLLLAWQKFPVISALYAGAGSQNFFGRIIGFILGVGVFEETCKALPLLFFSLKRGAISFREGVFLGVMSGLGFALAEVVQYSVNYWQQTAQLTAMLVVEAAGESKTLFGNIDVERFSSQMENFIPALGEHYGSLVLIQIVRFIPLPLLHAAWAGIVGWFIAAASAREGARWPTIVVGILFMALLHGVYDVFSIGLIGLAIAAFSVVAFLCYLMHGEETKPANASSAETV